MPRIQRSPPSDNINQTVSEPSLPEAIHQSEASFVNTNRNKRPRVHTPPKNDFYDFKSEIKEMMCTWKEDQEASISKMLGEQTALIKNLLTDITELKNQNNEIKNTNTHIINSIEFMNDKFDEIKAEVDILKKERQRNNVYIQDLEKKLNDLQQTSRTSSLEIRNVPAHEKEMASDLQEIVCNIGKLTNVPVNKTEIRDVYRIGNKQNTTRPIVVELATVQKKQSLLTGVRDYNKSKKLNIDKINTESINVSGKRQPIFISEFLPMTSRKLFHSTRIFAKEYNYQYCWCANGNIFLRKKEGDRQVLISSEQMLQELKQQLSVA